MVKYLLPKKHKHNFDLFKVKAVMIDSTGLNYFGSNDNQLPARKDDDGDVYGSTKWEPGTDSSLGVQ